MKKQPLIEWKREAKINPLGNEWWKRAEKNFLDFETKVWQLFACKNWSVQSTSNQN